MSSLIISTKFQFNNPISRGSLNTHKDIQIFKEINKIIPGSWLVDRTQNIQLPFNTLLLEKNRIPSLNQVESLSLLDCCIKKSKDLIHRQEHVYFLWSGGIDSTAALVGIILSEFPKDQITIACNADSIKEYSKFYKKHIRNNFSVISSEKLIQSLKYEKVEGLIINAEHGDILHGQDFGISMFKSFGKEYLESSITRNNILKFFLHNGMSEESANCWYDLFSSLDEYSPRNLRTMYDWSWWITYNWRWQWAGEKIKLRFKDEINFETFFADPIMQKWSATHEQYEIEKLADFKFDLKKIIFDYTDDLDYFNEKIKYPSRTFTYTSNAFSAIDSNLKRIKNQDLRLEEYYNPDNFINRWLICN